MAISSTQQADALFKASLGTANVNPSKAFYEMPKSYPSVMPSVIWRDGSLIPTTAPALTDQQVYSVDGKAVVKKWVDLVLTAVPGETMSFTHTALRNAIPFNFGDGSYNYTIKNNANTVIPFGTNDWVLQNGILIFYAGAPANMPPKITFYEYVGRQGSPFTFDENLIPTQNSMFDIGSAIAKVKNIYADELYLSASSLYVNGKKIVEDVSDTIVFSTDPNQDLQVKTSGLGDLHLVSDAVVNTQGNGGITANVPNTYSAKHINFNNYSNGGNVTFDAAGTNGEVQFYANKEISLTAPVVDVPGNLTALKFIGPLQGNADTATISSVAATANSVHWDNISSKPSLIPSSYLDTDATMAADSDTKIATQKAVKAYIAANGGSGTPGPAGADGADGKTILNGTIDPTGTDGVDGDFYINTSTNYIFGPKNGGAWGTGTSLIGPQGIQGFDGQQGYSAYEIAVFNGYLGTEQEWLESLVGPSGSNQGVNLYFTSDSGGPFGDTALKVEKPTGAMPDVQISLQQVDGLVPIGSFMAAPYIPGVETIPAGYWKFVHYSYCQNAGTETYVQFSVIAFDTSTLSERLLFYVTSIPVDNQVPIKTEIVSSQLGFNISPTERIRIKVDVYTNYFNPTTLTFPLIGIDNLGDEFVAHTETPLTFIHDMLPGIKGGNPGGYFHVTEYESSQIASISNKKDYFNILPIEEGGTGASSRIGAINTLFPDMVNGHFLRSNNFDTIWSPVEVGDIFGLQTAIDAKENVINKVTDTTFNGATNTAYPSALAVKTYVDGRVNARVEKNTDIVGATKTKITYDSKGLVTAGADAGIADISGLQTALNSKLDAATGSIAISQVTNLQTTLNGKEPTITTLPVNKGGTGATTTDGALANLLPYYGYGQIGYYLRVNSSYNGVEWAAIAGGAASWGNISGTLSSQTDLNTALNARLPLTGGTIQPSSATVPLLVKANSGGAALDYYQIYDAGNQLVSRLYRHPGDSNARVLEVGGNATANQGHMILKFATTGNSGAVNLYRGTDGSTGYFQQYWNSIDNALYVQAVNNASTRITFRNYSANPQPSFTLLANGKFGVNTIAPTATFQANAYSASDIGFIVKGAASATGDLVQMRDNSDNVLYAISAQGFPREKGRVMQTGTLYCGSSGFSDVSTLNVTIPSGKYYSFKYVLFITTTSNAGMRTSLYQATTGLASSIMFDISITNASTGQVIKAGRFTALDTLGISVPISEITGTAYRIEYTGYILTATSGYMIMKIGRSTDSTADSTIVLPGSYAEFNEMT